MEVLWGIPQTLAFFALVSGLALIASVFTGKLSLAVGLDVGILQPALAPLFPYSICQGGGSQRSLHDKATAGLRTLLGATAPARFSL